MVGRAASFASLTGLRSLSARAAFQDKYKPLEFEKYLKSPVRGIVRANSQNRFFAKALPEWEYQITSHGRYLAV
jgi:hypothetical protein